jgi:DNA-binding NtrC family response regulator
MKPPALPRRFNPVVDRFVTTDLPLQEIIASTAAISLSKIEMALLMLCDCLDGRRLARDAIEAAENVPMKGQDPELTILLLARWAELACRISRPSEAEALLHHARTLFTEQTHPEIRASIHFATSVLYEARGNQQEREKLLRQTNDELPEHSPRRKFYLWELGLLLARQGRGIEFKQEMKLLTWQTGTRFPLEQLDRLHFIDAVETGRTRAAAERMSALATAPAANRRLFREYQQLLALMHQARPKTEDRRLKTEDPTSEPGTTNQELGTYTPVWIQTLQHLMADDAAGALRLARLEAKRLLASIFGSGFGSLNLIRAELAAGNAEAASRLLEMRKSRGNAHYLDPFFAARCALLTDNAPQAAKQFREAQDAAQHYEATGRLDFELKLALEMPSRTPDAFLKATPKPKKTPPTTPGRETTGSKRLKPRLKVKPAPQAPTITDSRLPPIIGRSPAILNLRETILKMANQPVPVLITGETGTGKELVAVSLHQASDRADKPFIPVNCSAISETLLESELFGHERGSFTGADRTTGGLFEDAGEGTLLLDEIGDVSPRLQAVLLRALETGEVRAIGSSQSRKINCRILAATNADLEARVAEGTFRRDLLYRLQRLTIHVPPLRERREDIMSLVRHFLDEGRPVGTHASVSGTFVDMARQYDWPGNVRELHNVIERMRLTHSDKLTYTEADLDIRLPKPEKKSKSTRTASSRQHETAVVDASRPVARDHDNTPAPKVTEDIAHMLQQGTSALRRLERLRALFETHKNLTRAEIIRILQISPNTATKYLKTLCDEGHIRRIEPSASPRSHYFEQL